MGMLEGRWLADSMTDEEDGEVECISGNIEDEDSPRHDSPRHLASTSAPPVSKWRLTAAMHAFFAALVPDTREIRLQGIVLRWILFISVYGFVFCGPDFFGFNLEALIPSSRQPAVAP